MSREGDMHVVEMFFEQRIGHLGEGSVLFYMTGTMAKFSCSALITSSIQMTNPSSTTVPIVQICQSRVYLPPHAQD